MCSTSSDYWYPLNDSEFFFLQDDLEEKTQKIKKIRIYYSDYELETIYIQDLDNEANEKIEAINID